MERIRRKLALFLVLTMFACMFSVSEGGGVYAQAGGRIVNMKCEDETNPIGVDSASPRFSWQMETDETGWEQSAYRVLVAADADFSGLVWDSGKQKGASSIGIKYGGQALEASRVYYWKAEVWDQNGGRVSSEVARFETGLLDGDGWAGAEWIQVGTSLKQPAEEQGPLTYCFEADFQIEKSAVSPVFQAAGKSDFLMWQFQADGGRLYFRPHYKVGGGYVLIGQDDVSAYLSGDAKAAQRLKVEVKNLQIDTYLNGHLISTITEKTLNGMRLSGAVGDFGFRVTDNGQESGWLDNIRLTGYVDGGQAETLAEYGFDDGVNPFTDGSVRDGRLYMSNESASEVVALRQTGKDVPDDLHYTVEADITCQEGAASIVFNAANTKNFYLFQLNKDNDDGKVWFKPHTWKNNGFAIYGSHVKDATELVGGAEAFKTVPAHIKIDVTALEIKTYINGTLLDTFPFKETQGIAPVPGYIGIRSSDTERFTADNLKMTDLSGRIPKVVYDYTFDDPDDNPFLFGSIENGVFEANGDGVLLPPLGSPTFRKEIELRRDSPVVSARLYTSALGVYETYIDGERAGHETEDGIRYDELKPGNARPGERAYYTSYDVTGMLRGEARHTISATLTSGWYTGQIAKPQGKEEAFLAKLAVTYENGETDVFCTDRTWKSTLTGPVLMGDIYQGEVYDGKADLSYRLTEYDDAAWYYADRNDEFDGEITSQMGAAVRIREDLTRQAQSITVYEGVTGADETKYGKINVVGRYTDGEAFVLQPGQKAVVDFGQNFAGWDEICLEGERGTKLKMRHAEILNDQEGLKSRMNDGPEGSLYTKSLRTAKAEALYFLSGVGVETYHSSFTYYGFRYSEISADRPVTIHGLRGLVVTSVMRDTGRIETSDESVNRLYSNIRWGQYSNYLSIPTDCPQRNEREGWTGDTQVFAVTASYNADSKAFLTKWMADMRDAQRDEPGAPLDGAYPDMAPGYGYMGELGWADAGIIVPYQVYKMYGDTDIIEENYASMQKYIDVYLAKSEKKGGGRHYGDWLSYESNDDEIRAMLGVLYYALDADYMSKMAAALGKADDAERYRRLFETEKAYFTENYVRADGALKRSEQSVNAMALYVDILPDEKSYEAVKKTLLDNIARNGNKLQTGFLGTAVLMQTLSKIGASDVAYKLLLQRENPSWLYSVDQGATTIWERWNSYTVEDGFIDNEMNSFNHYAYGVVGEWMYSYMAGILFDEADPGFKHFLLSPQPDRSLTYVNSSFDGPYGTIVSNWEYKNGSFLYTAAVPPNTSATVCLPLESGGDTVLVNGAPLKTGKGIQSVERKNGKAVIEVGSGTYRFQVIAEGAFVPVSGIEDLPDSAVAGVDLHLTGTVKPAGASVQDIVWTVKDAGTTGAVIEGESLRASAPGTAVLTAAIPSGSAVGSPFTREFTITVKAKTVLKGDLNGDGKVNISDVMEACKVLARKSAGQPPTEEEIDRGDLDGNGTVNITDVMGICKKLANKA